MCSSTLTFAQIDAARDSPHVCSERRFPSFLGSAAGITKIQVMEIDITDRIAVAGTSTDTSFVSISNNLFVGIYGFKSFNFTWVTEFPSSLTSVA